MRCGDYGKGVDGVDFVWMVVIVIALAIGVAELELAWMAWREKVNRKRNR